MSTPARAPDTKDYNRALSEQGWWLDRQTKHGKMYRSPNGKHTFILQGNPAGREWRAIKNQMAQLRRQGGEALALANALSGRQDELHLPRVSPVYPPKPHEQYMEHERQIIEQVGGWDVAQYKMIDPVITAAAAAEREAMEAQVAARRAAMAIVEEPKVVTSPRRISHISEEAQARAAADVVRIIVEHFDGDLTLDKAGGRRSVTPALARFSDRSGGHLGMGVGHAEDRGWVVSDWPGGVGTKAGRDRITVTKAGYEAIGQQAPEAVRAEHYETHAAEVEAWPEVPAPSVVTMATPSEGALLTELHEMEQLVHLAEAERDEARVKHDVQKGLTVQFEQRADEMTRRVEALEAELSAKPSFNWQWEATKALMEKMADEPDATVRQVYAALAKEWL